MKEASRPGDPSPGRPYVIFGKPCLGPEEIEAVGDVLRSGWIGTGPVARAFEEEFARRKGVDDALALASCTAALHLGLEILGLRPGDEVITTPITFPAAHGVLEHLGLRPVFVDVDPETGNLDAGRVRDALTERTAAVLVVHLAGRPVDLGPILEVRDERGIALVEDCAHAIESLWRGRPVGTLGDVACFSFYANKNVTSAEGGMLLARDRDLLERARRLSRQGLSADAWARFSGGGGEAGRYELLEPGYKLNLPDVLAAIGLAQLRKLDAFAARREALWSLYLEELAGLPLDLPPEPPPGDRHARHLFSPRLRLEEVDLTRDELRALLHRRGIGTGVHYMSLHLQPHLRRRLALPPGDLPHARSFSERTFSIPLSGCLPPEAAQRVTRTLREILS